ncbi:helix-turn-helix domain-containing protein [Streptomyces sp. NBC_01373]|uniref:helix-turn-helix domain-containing protein n=1 Tax=Streptomyces sp. NBC_01373 TaxID=2903843 RepID=UPI0022566928|nr:helix-turn-helix domain-containing protein [Streptomyces sp. NBC_01373]MCX4706603.1 helix-turn-helix domain-containing protein [Streptomyces sp. NBC_01373]
MAAPLRNQIWGRMTAHYLVPLELHARGDSILGSLAGRTSGSVNFANLRATAHWGVRTVGSAADGVGAGRYKLAMGVEGRVTVEQYGREAILLPGQLAIYDTSDDYRVGSSQRFGVLITMIRADVLDLPPARVAALSATTLPEDCAAALKPLILDPLHDDSRLEPALAAISQTLRRTAPSVRRSIRDHDLVGEALEVIEERLADARLSPGFLAARLGVSRRRLYQACAAEIGPVAGYIRSRRLETARELLGSPELAGHTVAEVAADVGFPDDAHFNRLFAGEYGVPPGRYRTIALGS